MKCMKCGVEIPETQVFCDHCLEIMEHYPVKADYHVHLPKRPDAVEAPQKPSKKKRTIAPEELISNLRIKVMRLRLVIVILLFLMCLLGGYLGITLYQHHDTPITGRNYTIDTTMS